MSPAGPVVPGKLALPRSWYLIKHNKNQFRDYMTIGPVWLTAILRTGLEAFHVITLAGPARRTKPATGQRVTQWICVLLEFSLLSLCKHGGSEIARSM